jgi:hypothetical protein
MSLIYSMLMSVDGYVEDEHGRFGFAQPDEEVHAYINQLSRTVRSRSRRAGLSLV